MVRFQSDQGKGRSICSCIKWWLEQPQPGPGCWGVPLTLEGQSQDIEVQTHSTRVSLRWPQHGQLRSAAGRAPQHGSLLNSLRVCQKQRWVPSLLDSVRDTCSDSCLQNSGASKSLCWSDSLWSGSRTQYNLILKEYGQRNPINPVLRCPYRPWRAILYEGSRSTQVNPTCFNIHAATARAPEGSSGDIV